MNSIGAAPVIAVFGEETFGVTRSEFTGDDAVIIVAFEVICSSVDTLGKSLMIGEWSGSVSF